MSYTQPVQSGKRLAGLTGVVVLHGVLIYVLSVGLAHKSHVAEPQRVEVGIVEAPKPAPPERRSQPVTSPVASPTPPATASVAPQHIDNSLVAPNPVETTLTPATVVQPKIVEPVQAKPHVPQRSPAVVSASACAKQEYPPAAFRAGESGTVLLGFLIDVDGKVLESKVERSSGYRRLDEAAKKALGLCGFVAATLDGKPEKSWAHIEYEWKIE